MISMKDQSNALVKQQYSWEQSNHKRTKTTIGRDKKWNLQGNNPDSALSNLPLESPLYFKNNSLIPALRATDLQPSAKSVEKGSVSLITLEQHEAMIKSVRKASR